MRVRPLIVGLVSTIAAGAMVAALVTAGPASARTRANRWTVVPAARVSGGTSLAAVAAVSPTNVWAVGSRVGPGFSDPHHPLIEHNNGSGWKSVPAPNVGAAGGDLRAVAAVSAHDIWAVGNAGDNPVAMHYDGTRWKAVPTAPNPAGKQPGGVFLAVSAVSTNDVWAAGERPTSDGPGVLIQHWDGRHWKFVAAPLQEPTDFNAIFGLGVVSAHDIWAVGSRGDDFNEPMVEHWNGTSWTLVSVPELPQVNPDDPKDVGLNAVTVVSAHDVWAVGAGETIEHFDGRTWKIVKAPHPAQDSDGLSTILRSVSARTTNDIWAVGSANGTPVSLHWNGTAWSLVPVPVVAGSTSTDPGGVVAVPGGGTTAVGTRETAAGPRAVILHNDR
jgi:hypothetical protein